MFNWISMIVDVGLMTGGRREILRLVKVSLCSSNVDLKLF